MMTPIIMIAIIIIIGMNIIIVLIKSRGSLEQVENKSRTSLEQVQNASKCKENLSRTSLEQV